MNKFRLEDVKLSKKADAKIKRQLYIMKLQKKLGKVGESFTNIGGLLKILAPVCVFAFVILGVNGLLNSSDTQISNTHLTHRVVTDENNRVSKSLAKTIVSDISKDKYKKRSVERIRSQKYKKYKQLSQVRSLRARAYKRG